MKTRFYLKVISKPSTLLKIEVDTVTPPSSPRLYGTD